MSGTVTTTDDRATLAVLEEEDLVLAAQVGILDIEGDVTPGHGREAAVGRAASQKELQPAIAMSLAQKQTSSFLKIPNFCME